MDYELIPILTRVIGAALLVGFGSWLRSPRSTRKMFVRIKDCRDGQIRILAPEDDACRVYRGSKVCGIELGCISQSFRIKNVGTGEILPLFGISKLLNGNVVVELLEDFYPTSTDYQKELQVLLGYAGHETVALTIRFIGDC